MLKVPCPLGPDHVFYSLKEAAKKADVHEQTLRAFYKAEKIDALSIERGLWFDKKTVDDNKRYIRATNERIARERQR